MDSAAFQAVTLAIALLGAFLGVLNTWRNWSLDRLKIRVIPRYAVGNDGSPYISIEIINLSSFPVSVISIGFTVLGGATHMQVPIPIFTRGETLPIRLETRTSCTTLVPLRTFEKDQLASIDKAYISTACGKEIAGDSAALQQIIHAAITSAH